MRAMRGATAFENAARGRTPVRAARAGMTAMLFAVIGGGCGTPTPPPSALSEPDEVPSAAPRATPPIAFEQRLRDRAASQARQGRLAEAATSLEVLTVLRPEERDYRERLAEIRRLIDVAVPERMQRGAQALKRGELDAAAIQYLSALALQPDNAAAAEAMRSVERERNKRSFLGKPSRLTLTRRAVTDGQTPPSRTGPALDRNELEHAAMLATQGEYDDAIALLERHLGADRRDVSACKQLADLYYQKAEKQWPRDRAGAIAALERSVRLDASNLRAVARLRQLKGSAAAATASPPTRDACAYANVSG